MIKSKVEVNETSLITVHNLFRVSAESILLCVAVQKKNNHTTLQRKIDTVSRIIQDPLLCLTYKPTKAVLIKNVVRLGPQARLHLFTARLLQKGKGLGDNVIAEISSKTTRT